VLHVQRGFRMSKSYAEQVMRDHCTITWIDRDQLTIRDTTDEERIALRAEQAQKASLREPMPYAEIHGLKFEPPASGASHTRVERKLVWEAHQFALRAA
jgi:hypothetical protein